MYEEQKNFFWILTLASILLALADGILTYLGTPDLKMEANPLVANLGLGWGALITANFLILGLQTMALYYALIIYKTPLLPYDNYKEFSSMLFFNRPDKFIWMLYKPPKNWKPAIAALGYAFAIALPAARIVTIFDWTLHLTNSPIRTAYINFCLFFPFARFDVVFAMVIGMLMIVYWTFREFHIHQKMSAAAENNE